MKNTSGWAAALAVVMVGCIGQASASPEYRKDPAVRAAVEQKLKTGDAAEIRRRWGLLSDLAGKYWLQPGSGPGSGKWFSLSWAVQGAVLELTMGTCRSGKCEVWNPLLVHNPEASAWSFSNPLGSPMFNVLSEDGRHDGMRSVVAGVASVGPHNFQFDAALVRATVDGVQYQPSTAEAIAAATGYSFQGVVATAVKPTATEEKPKTLDAAEIRKRWGILVDLADKAWLYERGGSRTWFHLQWTKPGVEMEYRLAHCPGAPCKARKARLVHNPEGVEDSGIGSLFGMLADGAAKKPGFDVLWEDGEKAVGLVHESGVKMDGYEYELQPSKTEVHIRGIVYKSTTPADLTRLTGYVLPGAPVAAEPKATAKAGEPAEAAKPAAPALVPVVAKGTVRGGLLGAELDPKDPARAFDGPQVLKVVVPNGPAASAGLAVGDVIESIGGIERPTMGDTLRTILGSPNQIVPIVVSRNGQSIARSVKLGERTAAGPCFVLGLPDYQYDGECKDGFAHGRGELSFSRQFAGKQELVRYSGGFARGYMEGRGRLLTSTFTYEGELAGNLRHGHGKLAWTDGRPGFEGQFAHNNPVGLKEVGEAVVVCTRPDVSGKFECDTPQRSGVAGGPGLKSRPDTPQALVASLATACPSQRRLPSRTHLVWACGYGATNAPGAVDRGAGVEMRGRGTYHCVEREAGCKRTDAI